MAILRNKKIIMVNNFIIYVVGKCFKGYFYALAIFSIFVIVLLSSVTKFILQYYRPEILFFENVKASFQLSIFLFIPLFLFLLIKKYKYNALMNDNLKVRLPYGLCVFFTCILLLIEMILFSYLLI